MPVHAKNNPANNPARPVPENSSQQPAPASFQTPGSSPAHPLDLASFLDSPARQVVMGHVLFIHAHPDDEAVQTGALVAALAARTQVSILTCTRGEMGEAIPGVLPENATAQDFIAQRLRETARGREILGAQAGYFLGIPPALAPGAHARHYSDSGMRWIREGLAGPAPQAPANALALLPLAQEVDDAVTLATAIGATVLIGYDAEGSYGHPDHLRAHEIALGVARRTGLPLFEIASSGVASGSSVASADTSGDTFGSAPGITPGGAAVAPPAEGAFTWVDVSGYVDTAARALAEYRTQLSLVEKQGRLMIRHVGGQYQEIYAQAGLRARSLP
ncbi:N-acetyl-1-D-myo-inositol-2-amino-2-deoxy-alpha-D-glucopyranoside deacetylase [Actinobaculum suis]|uniref:N-acetyl-1-D-myo-inositol-2-amino-2-deoxy-alpha-D-glucopyranoside deacetylase n=1 Tax=Actinobaculum suis TaxID=1657 RepID=A0A1G7B725_9ACTO|nr:PIG-L family deacetylase [Actinobaculum suis]MDY5153640.1 PIG-L family deacetylase [Actinobaculum suis]SDE22918.1 N-acetyl-1-D-myo-inositol-2-amino-2-deoxy-alpha-D-glucopyranoside deacetylase [Actinobaculum suis]